MPHPPPIILIGTQRSGTTWMGDVFARHPRLAYWPEPRHVWTSGNSYRPDDVLTAADARPSVTRRIRAIFDRFVEERGKDRLVEKTPSNCLRMPFIRAIYPDAKMILIVRDGRSVMRSTGAILEQGVPGNRIVSRALETPLWEWPAYIPRAASTIYRKVARKPLAFWGPRPPGWRDWVRNDPREVILAKQWAATISRAIEDGLAQPPELFFQYKYEEFMARPRENMERLLDFCQLENAGDVIEFVTATADPARQHKWKDEIDEGTLDLVRPHMEPTLNRLGYEW
jgi:hypothetical protein